MCAHLSDCRLAATEIREQAHARAAAVREVQYHLTSTLFGLGTVEQVDPRMQEYNELQEACFKGTGAMPQARRAVNCFEGACQGCIHGVLQGACVSGTGAMPHASGGCCWGPCFMDAVRTAIMAHCRSLTLAAGR